jgi:uncharacterized repeat protein (TIGR01451 family)
MATVTGVPPAPLSPVQAQSTTTVTMSQVPGIRLNKNSSSNGALTAGAVITYRFLVTNTGTVTLNNVAVTDPMAG